MKNFFKCLFTRIVLVILVAGIFLVIGSIGNTITSLKTPKTFEDILDNGMEEGDYIKGELVYSFYSFAVEDTVKKSKYGSTHTEKGTAEYYLIPVEGGFAGLKVNKKDISAAEKNSDETFDYLDEKIDDTSTRPVFEGKVEPMKSELVKYYISYLKELDYTQEEIENMGEIYVINPISGITNKILTIVGFLLIILGIVIAIFKANKMATAENNNYVQTNQMNGGYAGPNYNNQMNGGYAEPNYNNQMNGGYAEPNYNNQMNGGYAEPNYNNQMNGGYAEQNYNNQMNNDNSGFNNFQ